MSAAAAREIAPQSIGTCVIPAELQSLRLELAALLTVAEVAELFGVNSSSVHRWVKEKKLPAPFKLGGAVQRFSRDAILAHLATEQSREPFEGRTRKASRAEEQKALVKMAFTTMQFEWDDGSLAREALATMRAEAEREPERWLDRLRAFVGRPQ